MIGRRVTSLIGITAVCFAYGALSEGPAQARTLINSPFGTAAVKVIVGSFTVTPGGMGAVWQRISDGACAVNAIGNASGLSDDTELYGNNGDDNMQILDLYNFPPTQPLSFCGFALAGLTYNGHYLDLYGQAGNDQLYSQGGDTWLFGGAGNDTLTFAGAGNLFGGDGNDALIAFSASSTEGLYGENGSDCLEDDSGFAAVADCGPGTDKIAMLHLREPINVNCESTTMQPCGIPGL